MPMTLHYPVMLVNVNIIKLALKACLEQQTALQMLQIQLKLKDTKCSLHTESLWRQNDVCLQENAIRNASQWRIRKPWKCHFLMMAKGDEADKTTGANSQGLQEPGQL